MRVSIRSKLIVAIVLPILAVYLTVLAINTSSHTREARVRAEQHLTELASHHATRLDGRFQAAEQAARNIANLIVSRDPVIPPQTSSVFLGQRLLASPALFGALVAFEPGVVPGQSGRVGRYIYRRDPPRLAPQAGKGGRGENRQPARRGRTGGGQRAAAAKSWASRLRKGLPFRRGDLVKDNPDFHAELWYDRARTEKTPAWSEPRLTTIAPDSPVARFTMPLVRDGTFLGAIAFDLSIQHVCDDVRSARLEGGHCMLVSRSGLLVAHPSRRLQMRQTLYDVSERGGSPELAELADAMILGESGVRKLPMSSDNGRNWVVFSPVNSPGWSFAAVIPEARIMEPVAEGLRSNMAIMLAGLGVIIAMVLLVSIRVTRPIGRLAAAVRDVARGNLDARADGINSDDEIGEFAEAFNTMVGDLKHHVAALTDETAARQAVESELRVARDIQKSLLPRTFPPFPHRREFDLHALVVPARQVAGDFFDFFFINDDVLALLVADVSGKGAPAAIFMAMTRTVIRAQAMTGQGPADVLTRANHIIAGDNNGDNDRAMFVTVFFAHYDTRSGRLVYANAGHNPPCIGTSGNGSVRRLSGSTGPILGVFDNRQYAQRDVALQVGDCLVLYTDGVTEALDAQDRQFGLERFEKIVARHSGDGPREITDLVVRSVRQHRSYPQQDDMTLLALRRNQ